MAFLSQFSREEYESIKKDRFFKETIPVYGIPISGFEDWKDFQSKISKGKKTYNSIKMKNLLSIFMDMI